MDDLQKWMQEQIQQKKIEPNSGLGQAIHYMLNRWQTLTRFLSVPGAPLDNNVAERALKMAILHRKNSLSFKTLHGARIGDVHMSLIHTCELNRVKVCHRLSMYWMASPRPELGSTFFCSICSCIHFWRSSITGWLCAW